MIVGGQTEARARLSSTIMSRLTRALRFARARADDAKIVRSRDTQCNTKELGDSRVFIAHSYCAQFLRHQRARVQNIRDFLQTKLGSEIKAPFLLNEHGDPHFFL